MKRLLLFLFIMSLAAPGMLAQAGDTLWLTTLKDQEEYLKVGEMGVALKFSPDESMVYTVGSLGACKFDANTGKILSFFEGRTKQFYDFYFADISDDFSRIAASSGDNGLFIWDVKKEAVDTILNMFSATLFFSADNKQLFVLTRKTIYIGHKPYDEMHFALFDLSQKKFVKDVNLGVIDIMNITHSPDRSTLLVQFQHPDDKSLMSLQKYDMATLEKKGEPFLKDTFTYGIACPLKYSSDGKLLAGRFSSEKNLSIYNFETGEVKELFSKGMADLDLKRIAALCFSKDNKFIIVASSFKSDTSMYGKSITAIMSLTDLKEKKRYYGGINAYEINAANNKFVCASHGQMLMIKPGFESIGVEEPKKPTMPYIFSCDGKKIYIESEAPVQRIEISTSTGAIVLRQANREQSLKFTADVGALPAGAYFCRIICGEQVFTEKFLVVR